ncbi:hypothetical protein NPIL_88931 [Nephila pilipes]|uniref:Uncharacterized protein n=1 Tax=Nephila pilipes TaxID=299642 RepID=A0A8X6UAF8_NEPPI|nr:hypothetical protein NPIL_88931 [Nephila pilipes]
MNVFQLQQLFSFLLLSKQVRRPRSPQGLLLVLVCPYLPRSGDVLLSDDCLLQFVDGAALIMARFVTLWREREMGLGKQIVFTQWTGGIG